MADMTCDAAGEPRGPRGTILLCSLPEDHDGPHWDRLERLSWRVVASKAIPRVTQEYLTPSADLPACRDEDPAHQAALAAAYPDPPEYAHPEEPPLKYTDADRAYDRDAFARDYGLRDG